MQCLTKVGIPRLLPPGHHRVPTTRVHRHMTTRVVRIVLKAPKVHNGRRCLQVAKRKILPPLDTTRILSPLGLMDQIRYSQRQQIKWGSMSKHRVIPPTLRSPLRHPSVGVHHMETTTRVHPQHLRHPPVKVRQDMMERENDLGGLGNSSAVRSEY